MLGPTRSTARKLVVLLGIGESENWGKYYYNNKGLRKATKRTLYKKIQTSRTMWKKCCHELGQPPRPNHTHVSCTGHLLYLNFEILSSQILGHQVWAAFTVNSYKHYCTWSTECAEGKQHPLLSSQVDFVFPVKSSLQWFQHWIKSKKTAEPISKTNFDSTFFWIFDIMLWKCITCFVIDIEPVLLVHVVFVQLFPGRNLRVGWSKMMRMGARNKKIKHKNNTNCDGCVGDRW